VISWWKTNIAGITKILFGLKIIVMVLHLQISNITEGFFQLLTPLYVEDRLRELAQQGEGGNIEAQ
jgi:hypothetical protein